MVSLKSPLNQRPEIPLPEWEALTLVSLLNHMCDQSIVMAPRKKKIRVIKEQSMSSDQILPQWVSASFAVIDWLKGATSAITSLVLYWSFSFAGLGGSFQCVRGSHLTYPDWVKRNKSLFRKTVNFTSVPHGKLARYLEFRHHNCSTECGATRDSLGCYGLENADE